jgi:hypothetical protein
MNTLNNSTQNIGFIQSPAPMINKESVIFVLPPIGVGDTIVWLPFLVQSEKIMPSVIFHFPKEIEWMAPIYEASHLNKFKFIGLEAASLIQYERAFLLNDEKEMLDKYDPILREITIRIGLKRGKYRAKWLTKKISPSLFGRPKHESLRNLRLGLALDKRPQRNILEDSALASRAMQHQPPLSFLKKYIVLHPYSHGHGREWPLSNYIELGSRFRSLGYRVILSGSLNEQIKLAQHAEEISAAGLDLSGQLDLRGLIQLLADASLMVGASTGPTHLAASLGTKTIGLYPAKKGLSLQRWAPIGTKAIGLQKNVCNQKKCDQNICECMRFLSVEMVEFIGRKCIAAQKPLSFENIKDLETFVPEASVLR